MSMGILKYDTRYVAEKKFESRIIRFPRNRRFFQDFHLYFQKSWDKLLKKSAFLFEKERENGIIRTLHRLRHHISEFPCSSKLSWLWRVVYIELSFNFVDIE
jgi:hypothetical protein